MDGAQSQNFSEEKPSNRSTFIECQSPYFPEMPDSLSEVGDLDPTLTGEAMREAAWSADGGQTWRVAIIESCVSDNNNWYRGEVLRESIPVFEGSPCRIYQYDGRMQRNGSQGAFHHDHMPGWLAARDAGSVTGNTVGAFRNVLLEEIPSQRRPGSMCEALTADLVFIDATTRNRVFEAHRQGLMSPNGRSLFELSIEASGPHQNVLHESLNRSVRMVEGIDEVKEVTIVSQGAAGGRFLYPVTAISESASETVSESSPISEKSFVKDLQAEENSSNKSPTNGGATSFTEGPLQRIGGSTPYAVNDALPGANYSADDALNSQSNGAATNTPENNEMIPQFGDDDLSQMKKALDVLRTGNLSLGAEILTEVISRKTEEPAMANASTGGATQNQMIPMKESKEPRQMTGNQGVESAGQGSEGQMAGELLMQEGYTARDIEDFARLVSERDAQRDAEFSALREAFVAQGQMIEQQSKIILQTNRENKLRECARVLQTRLRESKLPKQTQALIAHDFAGREFDENVLIQHIDRHRTHVVQLAESMHRELGGMSRANAGYGEVSIAHGRNAFDSVAAEIDRAFGYKPELDKSLTESQRDLYKALPFRPSIKRPMGIWHGDQEYNFDGRVGEGALLREAASTDAGLAALLQNSMTKSVMQKFMLLPASYREVAEIVPAANFLEHQVIVTGGLGIMPRVLESKTGVSYLTLGFPSTFQTTYTVGTYGGLIPVTRQAIINDNLQEIQEAPKRAAESAMMTLNMMVFGTLIGYYGTGSSGAINTATSYDGTVYYHDNHFNKTASALSYQSLIDMQNRLFEQRTFGNTTTLAADIAIGDNTFTVTNGVNDFAAGVKAGDVIQIDAERVKVASVSSNTVTIVGTFAAVHTSGSNTKLVFQLSTPIAFDKRLLIVPTQLAHVAYQLLASTLEPGTTTNSASALNPAYVEGSLRLLQLHSMFLQDDINNYYMVAGKPIRWAFLGGRETPEIMLQDNPLVGNVFSGDLISWKARHEHGGVLMSHLMVQGGIVA